MVETNDIQRPPKDLIDALAPISSATAAGELARLGIRDPHIQGPVARIPGKHVVGPALTLQFMPKREDQYSVDEYADPEKQLHRHALYHTQPGDIIVVDARGERFGERVRGGGKGGVDVLARGEALGQIPERDDKLAGTGAGQGGWIDELHGFSSF